MSLNKVLLIGNVGQEPEVRYIDNDMCTANFSLATTSRGYVLQNGTNVPERTEWHHIVMWANMAKIVENYVHKGDKVFIEGELRYRSYTDKRGNVHKSVEIWATNIEMFSKRPQQTENKPVVGNKNGPFPPSSAENKDETGKKSLPF